MLSGSMNEQEVEKRLHDAGVWGWANKIGEGNVFVIQIHDWDRSGYMQLEQNLIPGITRFKTLLIEHRQPIDVSYSVYEFTVEVS